MQLNSSECRDRAPALNDGGGFCSDMCGVNICARDALRGVGMGAAVVSSLADAMWLSRLVARLLANKT